MAETAVLELPFCSHAARGYGAGRKVMELMVPLASGSEIPLYEQIYYYIKEEIRCGNLKAGARLPSTRNLAEHLKISRSTSQMAYEQLTAEGYLESIPCRGYFVAEIEEPSWESFAGKAEKPGRVEKRESSEAHEALVDFTTRGIDLNSFPFNTWRKISKNTLIDDNKELFAGGHPMGEQNLREAIREYLHLARGVNCSSRQIIVGAGNEYLLLLLSRILGVNHVIAMENPTYKQAYRVLASSGCQVVPVDMDKSGMSAEKLRKSGADIAYVMPSHQYPMGIVMPVKRRQELLSWAAEKEGRYLIEDDYDSEFRYKGKPVPALQGMDRHQKVIYMGTFSQSIAPAIRVGFLVLPEELLESYQEKAGFFACTVSRIDQNVLYHFIHDGYYERHLNRMRGIYKMKHDALLSALKPLEKHFNISGEYSGLHVLLTYNRKRTEEELIKKASEAGVKVYGLSSYFIHKEHNDYPATILLGYANLSAEEIKKGAGILCRVWK